MPASRAIWTTSKGVGRGFWSAWVFAQWSQMSWATRLARTTAKGRASLRSRASSWLRRRAMDIFSLRFLVCRVRGCGS